MADQFYDDIPARANNIGTDVDQIELSLGYIKDVFQKICSWHDDTLTNIVVGNVGQFTRAKYSWKDTDEIYIDPGSYFHYGSTQQMTYWAAQLTYQFGSGGSNSGSEDLDAGAQEVQYLYIDDSVLVTDSTNVITNARLLNSAEAPTWNAAKWGWYPSSNGTFVQTSDRCIGAFLINASNEVVEFYHDGGDLLLYADYIEDKALADIDTTWTDVTLSIPGFCTKAEVSFRGSSVTNASNALLVWRTNGQTGTTGHAVLDFYGANNALTKKINTARVITDSSQKIEIKHTVSDACQSGVYTDGWYFPIGM